MDPTNRDISGLHCTTHVLNTAMQSLTYSTDQTLNSQQTPHISHTRASYGVSVVNIWEKINYV